MNPLRSTEVGHRILKVPASKLRIHTKAQKAIVRTVLERIKQQLDLNAIGTIHVVAKDLRGTEHYYVIDGQHRVRALVETGNGEFLVDVEVHDDVKTDAEACGRFLKLNYKGSIRPFYKYKNALIAGFPTQVGIERLAEKHGLQVCGTSTDGGICCVNVLEKVYNLNSGVILDNTLGVVISAWGKTSEAVEGAIINGVATTIRDYSNLDLDDLSKRLAKWPGGASGLIGKARALKEAKRISLSAATSELLELLLNSRRKHPLVKGAQPSKVSATRTVA